MTCPKGAGQPLLTGARVAAPGFIREVAIVAKMNSTLGLNNKDLTVLRLSPAKHN